MERDFGQRGVSMKIGFIGAGKVGSAFGRYLFEKGLEISGYFSRSLKSSEEAALFTKSKPLSMKELVEVSDYIFITTPDDVISEVWQSLKKFNLKGKRIFHMSGCLSLDVFDGYKDLGLGCYCLHPLYPFNDRNCFKKLEGVIFSLEGDNIEGIKDFLQKSQIKYFLIKKENKAKYHLAAVFASNYLVSLAKISKELLLESGIKEEFIIDAIYPLMEGALNNIKEKGVEGALTGPIVRGDYLTVKRHVENAGIYKNIYKELGKIALCIERLKNVQGKKEKLDKIEEILRG